MTLLVFLLGKKKKHDQSISGENTCCTKRDITWGSTRLERWDDDDDDDFMFSSLKIDPRITVYDEEIFGGLIL